MHNFGINLVVKVKALGALMHAYNLPLTGNRHSRLRESEKTLQRTAPQNCFNTTDLSTAKSCNSVSANHHQRVIVFVLDNKY